MSTEQITVKTNILGKIFRNSVDYVLLMLQLFIVIKCMPISSNEKTHSRVLNRRGVLIV